MNDNYDFYFGIGIGIAIVLLHFVFTNYAFADSIFIDDYRPIGRESVVQVTTFEYENHMRTFLSKNVTMSINNSTYSGESNRYGYIAFPIKLTDNVFEPRVYDITITVDDNIYNRTLTVLESWR